MPQTIFAMNILMNSKMYKTGLYLILIVLSISNGYSQRIMEDLGRGLIAMRTGSNSVLISWRITGNEYAQDATYNLYRGETLIASNLNVSNYVDQTNSDNSYSVSAVIGGAEKERSAASGIRGRDYFSIPVKPINGSYANHNINDASVGDLDGDGEYEIVVKRLANDESPDNTNYHNLEAYELDGTFMWSINLGPNLMHNVEVNFLVYDLDNDGKAEVATRTSDGMIDGLGKDIGDRNGDGRISYRSSAALNGPFWFRTEGPDYISIFDGETGGEIAWENYISLAPIVQWGQVGMSPAQLGHRATKCMWAVAYTDGVNPSFVISRGIYARIKLEAWHFRDGALTQEWAWDSDPNGVASDYHGQGNHNLAAGDLDGDGRDEVTYGGMAVDEYGKGMYSTRFGHGDAGHLADINPDIPGLEFYSCQEYANGGDVPGTQLRSAKDGTIQWASWGPNWDVGRCMAADIDPNHYGMEIWGSDGAGLRNCKGEQISNTIPTGTGGGASYNFGIWWDGDVQREILDRSIIGKWNGSGTDRIVTFWQAGYPIDENNGTKYNPCLMADIMGDWREELIYRNPENTSLTILVTPYPTDQRMYTLMHDPNYRSAVAWQNNAYNQPPNLGFYFGGGMITPPKPNIVVGECARNLNPVDYGLYNQSLLDYYGYSLENLDKWVLPTGSSLILYEEDDFNGNYEIVHSAGNCFTDLPDLSYQSVIFSEGQFAIEHQYSIKSKSTNKLITVDDGADYEGALISTAVNADALFQTWKINQSDDGFYVFNAEHTGLVMEIQQNIYPAQSALGDSLNATQLFEIIPVVGNTRYFQIKNKNNQQCLEVDISSDQIYCKACEVGNENQMFYDELSEVKTEEQSPLSTTTNSPVINLYPNPTNGLIQLAGVEVSSVKIYTVSGQFLQERKLNNKNILDISYLNSGVYVLHLDTPQGTEVVSIIKK